MAFGAARCSTGHLRSGVKLIAQAVELARNLGDPNTLCTVGFALILNRTAPQHTQENVQLAKELMASPRVGVNATVVGNVLVFAGNAFLALGKRRRVEELWGELRAVAKRTGQFNLWLMSTGMDALLALMDGHLEDAMDMVRPIRSRGEEAGVFIYANIIAGMADYRARVYLGRSLEALKPGLGIIVGYEVAANPVLCLVLALLGQKDEASEILEQRVVRRPGMGTAENESATFYDALFFEAAVLAGHRRAAELLLNRFTGTGVCISAIWYPTCIPRHMGGAAALLERYEEARNHYQEAIKVCTEMRFRPELALSRLELSELLLKHYPQEKSEAITHLDFVIPEFRDMKMNTYLERALRHKEILKA
jgi:tetratricopeptide (TPR) repeat protein